MLELVDERVLEGRVEQRREVGAPHHRAKRIQPTTGNDSTARRASAGPAGSSAGASRARHAQEQRDRRADRAISGAATSISRMCWTMWTREQRRVVALDARQQRERRARPCPSTKQTVRRRGTGLAGWAALTRRTAHAPPAERRRRSPAWASGSNVQPSSRIGERRRLGRRRAVRRGRAAAASQPRAHRHEHGRRGRTSTDRGRIAAHRRTNRSRADSPRADGPRDDARQRSGYHGRGPSGGPARRDLLHIGGRPVPVPAVAPLRTPDVELPQDARRSPTSLVGLRARRGRSSSSSARRPRWSAAPAPRVVESLYPADRGDRAGRARSATSTTSSSSSRPRSSSSSRA